ncbi:putative aldouronate transport system permease protein [Paenibacillus rhizosphaerae]|uniref:Putative aldouronate transport system permease protein n=1 Tax=Paenibacillus rhizosphaerae TaxID=297318 RepID=A0A839TRD2_9BACL|nr:carbohydrate ABC transporter permease [Paenibacillus rhizosphaerae]MBB3128230.1 putative aldouronate transport system permease protein [Paenibacillus rhizosphaerae]
MVHDSSWSNKLFQVCNYSFLILLSLLCVVPLVHVLAMSFSSSTEVEAGLVGLWPVDFTTDAYAFVLRKSEFLDSILVTLERLAIGVPLNLLLVTLLAYPLSKEVKVFPLRTYFAWFVVFTMLFNGGLIPTYMVVKETKLLDSIWSLILPGAIPVFHVVLLLNFFRGIPKELEEAAHMDGAGHWVTLFRIYLPLSAPVFATIGLFAMVGHWNAWFDGMIYMNHPDHYPLQTYLRTIIIDQDLTVLGAEDAIRQFENINPRTTRAAQVFLGSLPVLLAYPFLQKYFMKGIVLGSVKG